MLRAWAQTESTLLWPEVTLLLGLVMALALFYRRSAPGLSATFCYGAVTVLELVARAQGQNWDGLDPFVFIVVLAYAVTRWGSGAEMAAGLLAMLCAWAITGGFDPANPAGSAAAATVLLFPTTLGAVFRSQDRNRRRADAELRLRERTELARELHDSVAHHVAAIAVQAQGARALAAKKPEAATDALAVIEESAARALEEMRRVVGALREDDAAERLPLGTLADIEALAETAGVGPAITVTLRGDLEDLDASLEHTLYSIAREGVTNAIRHAVSPRSVRVEVEADTDAAARCVRLFVHDDGRHAAVGADRSDTGFGLRGMRERVELLGGTFAAGPDVDGGWRVSASLPREAHA